jgi:hypothetical protein
MPIPTTPLPPHMLAALERNSALEAIKLLRKHTGMGLAFLAYAALSHG